MIPLLGRIEDVSSWRPALRRVCFPTRGRFRTFGEQRLKCWLQRRRGVESSEDVRPTWSRSMLERHTSPRLRRSRDSGRLSPSTRSMASTCPRKGKATLWSWSKHADPISQCMRSSAVFGDLWRTWTITIDPRFWRLWETLRGVRYSVWAVTVRGFMVKDESFWLRIQHTRCCGRRSACNALWVFAESET